MSSYGRELLLRFVPPTAAARAPGLALMSGALMSLHGASLGGPVVELERLTYPALVGALRAARRADACVAVCVPPDARNYAPTASRASVEAIVRAARESHFDRPLAIVSRAAAVPIERVAEGFYRDLDAGFTSFGVGAQMFLGDVNLLADVCAPLLEQELGLELELGLDEDAQRGLMLAALDDMLGKVGLVLAAVRGASPDDELAGALLVSRVKVAVPHRLVLSDKVTAATDRIDPNDLMRQEACAFEIMEDALQQCGAVGVASRLLDALAQAV